MRRLNVNLSVSAGSLEEYDTVDELEGAGLGDDTIWKVANVLGTGQDVYGSVVAGELTPNPRKRGGELASTYGIAETEVVVRVTTFNTSPEAQEI